MKNKLVDEVEIDLLDLWRAISRKISLILVLVILFAAAGYGASQLLPKKYQTFTTMLLGMPEEYSSAGKDGLGIDDVNLNQKLIGTYSEFIKSRNVTLDVIQNLGLDMTYEQVRDMVNVNRLNNTEMISIEVIDTIPLRAKDIANEMADIFKIKIADMLKIDNIQIVDYAVVPERPVSPRVKRNIALGGILGGFIGIIVAVYQQIMDTTIKTADDITEYIGLPVLGMIPSKDSRSSKKRARRRR